MRPETCDGRVAEDGVATDPAKVDAYLQHGPAMEFGWLAGRQATTGT